MKDDYRKVIRVKNDPVTNRLTAPEKKLTRPKINILKIGLFILSVSTLIIFASSLSIYVVYRIEPKILNEFRKDYFYILIYLLWAFIVGAISSKKILITMIRLYQRYASAETRLKCCYHPTCSEYGVMAVDKFGAFRGTILTIKRLRRCELPGGIDFP